MLRMGIWRGFQSASRIIATPATPIVTRHKQLSNLSNSCSEIFWTQNDKSRRCREKWRKERDSGLHVGSDRLNESTGFERRELPEFLVSSSIPTLKTTKSPRVDVPGAFIRESLCYDNIGGGDVPSAKSDGGFLSSPKDRHLHYTTEMMPERSGDLWQSEPDVRVREQSRRALF